MGGDFTVVFNNLKAGLAAPLDGMGTASHPRYLASLDPGLSRVPGFTIGPGHKTGFGDLEEWLSSLTRLSSGNLAADGDQSVPAYVQALLEQTAESLENLQRTLARGEESNIASNSSLVKLTDSLGTLTK